MDEIQQSSQSFEKLWNKISSTPEHQEGVSARLANVEFRHLNHMVELVLKLMKYSRAPANSTPGYQVARSVAVSELHKMAEYVSEVAAGNYDEAQDLLESLISITYSFNVMTAFSDKPDREEGLASAIVKLADAEIRLKESVDKHEGFLSQAENSERLLKEITERHSDALKHAERIENRLDEILKKEEEFENLETEVREGREGFKSLTTECAELKRELEVKRDVVEEIENHVNNQSERVEDLLRGATAGRLASSFADRKKSLMLGIVVWGALFLLGVLGLSWYGYSEIRTSSNDSISVLWEFLNRAPVVGPLVWLSWFSARQYGLSSRIREDYAFKQATAIAFEGFRDHMRVLGEVEEEGGVSALNHLATLTIHNLSANPVRIFGSIDDDRTSPIGSMFGRSGRRASSRKKNDQGNASS